jgi:hypothetical protein
MSNRRHVWGGTPLLARVGSPRQALGALVLRPETMVLLRWDLHGERFEELVPLQWARRRRQELELLGAVVYWSERLAAAA